MTVLSAEALKARIAAQLADNNAGLISAQDVRDNIYDAVDSIVYIVASGNFDSLHPFAKNVKLRTNSDNTDGGQLIVESCIVFDNANGYSVQTQAYPGSTGIQHSGLAGLTAGDPHPQYLKLTGNRNMDANLGMGPKTNWINSSGITMTNNMHGISFEYVSTTGELMHVASGTSANFDIDNSKMPTAKGCAQAWIRFDGTSGNMQVLSSYNIYQLERDGGAGKFKVSFKPNTFADANYVAICSSNARSDDDTGEDFSHNTVGIVKRDKDYITFYVLDDAGTYIDAKVNDLIVFGNASGVTPSTGVIVVQ